MVDGLSSQLFDIDFVEQVEVRIEPRFQRELFEESQAKGIDGGDVDIEDFGILQRCYSGPGFPQEDATCSLTLLDSDLDVDQDDFVVFQRCFTAPNVPANPDCAD